MICAVRLSRPRAPGGSSSKTHLSAGFVAGISKISLDSSFGAVRVGEMSCVSSSVHYEETPLLRSQTRRLSGSRPSHSLVATLAIATVSTSSCSVPAGQ